MTEAGPVPRVVPQRAVLVLPSTAEYDSRSYRIARSLRERGHAVTIVARWRPGLPRDEVHPAGYRIVRVEASALDGLPLRGFVRAARVAVRRVSAFRSGTAYRPPELPRFAPAERAHPSAIGAVDADAGAGGGWAHVVRPTGGALPRRLVEGLIRRFRIFLSIRSQTRRALEVAPAADLWHGMAYMGIPVALSLRRRHGGRSVYDARDIYMEAANLAKMRGPLKSLLARMEVGWARRADRVVTVNEPYAGELERRFGTERPLVVMNCSYRYQPPDPPRRLFHERLDLDRGVRVVLYHGGFSPERGIEELIQAVRQVPSTVLVCMGYGVMEAQVRAWSEEPANRSRLHVLPAVPPQDLLDWVAAADVVGVLIQPTTLNHRLTTPNKFLEAMAAGVPSVVSDLPGMADIARSTGCAIPVEPTDVEAAADAIHRIVDSSPEERAAWRERALRAASQTYNWESQMASLLAEYERLTGRPW